MICPNCKKENANKYATVCAYCGAPLYEKEAAEEKAKELAHAHTMQRAERARLFTCIMAKLTLRKALMMHRVSF